MATTFSSIVRRTITRLSQVSGTSVQFYSEPVITEMVQHAFDYLFEKRFWEDYTIWSQGTLTDQGVVQEDLSDENGADLDRYTDIQYIFYNRDTRPLPRISSGTNVQRFISAGESRPSYHEPWAAQGKFFRVLPFGTTENVYIRHRVRPDPFEATSIVKMDDQLLILAAAYDYSEDDGTNPAQSAKLLGLFNRRYEVVLGSVGQAPVPIGPEYVADAEPWGNF